MRFIRYTRKSLLDTSHDHACRVVICAWRRMTSLRKTRRGQFTRLLWLSAEELPPLPFNTAIHVGKDAAKIFGMCRGILSVNYRLGT
ncbi:MAG: hypothetical protein WA045_09210, partial [Nitrospira sp.]